jgi:hypothetical protein
MQWKRIKGSLNPGRYRFRQYPTVTILSGAGHNGRVLPLTSLFGQDPAKNIVKREKHTKSVGTPLPYERTRDLLHGYRQRHLERD